MGTSSEQPCFEVSILRWHKRTTKLFLFLAFNAFLGFLERSFEAQWYEKNTTNYFFYSFHICFTSKDIVIFSSNAFKNIFRESVQFQNFILVFIEVALRRSSLLGLLRFLVSALLSVSLINFSMAQKSGEAFRAQDEIDLEELSLT